MGSIKLLMWLPGENAKNNRGDMAAVIAQVFVGDQAVHAVVDSNAAMVDPIRVLAREDLASDMNVQRDAVEVQNLPTVADMDQQITGMKRFREELELVRESQKFVIQGSYTLLNHAEATAENARIYAEQTAKAKEDAVKWYETTAKTLEIQAGGREKLYSDTQRQHEVDIRNATELSQIRVGAAKSLSDEEQKRADAMERLVDREERSLNILKERNAQTQLVPEPLSQQVQVSQISQSQSQTHNVKSILQLAVGMPEWVEIHVNTKGIILAKAGNAVLRASIPPCPNKVSETAPSGRLYDVYVYESIYFGQIVQIIRAAFAATQRGRNNGHILPGQANISAFFNGC